jgi:hypothetical protein
MASDKIIEARIIRASGHSLRTGQHPQREPHAGDRLNGGRRRCPSRHARLNRSRRG